VPNKVNTLPEYYNGKAVDYFYIWSCINPYGVDKCYKPSYLEIISQGTAVDTTGKTTLEHWARGSANSWEVYYDPEKIGWANCSSRDLSSTLDLNQPGNKKPLVMKLPSQANTYYVTEPVCTLVFNQFEQSKTAVKDVRYGSYSNSTSPYWWTGNWIVITINHERYMDNLNKEIVRAENIYLTDNAAAGTNFNKYCVNNPTDRLHCSNGTGLIYTLNGKVYYTFTYEEYWMRKTESSGNIKNLSGAPVRDLYGYGAFRWFEFPMNDSKWDMIRNDGSKSTDNGAGNQVFTMEKCTLDKWNNIQTCSN
jgi:hypothetical protein